MINKNSKKNFKTLKNSLFSLLLLLTASLAPNCFAMKKQVSVVDMGKITIKINASSQDHQFSPTGSALLIKTGSNSRYTIQLYSTQTGKPLWKKPIKHVRHYEFSHNENLLVVNYHDKPSDPDTYPASPLFVSEHTTLALYDVQTGKLKKKIKFCGDCIMENPYNKNSFTFTCPKGDFLAIPSHDNFCTYKEQRKKKPEWHIELYDTKKNKITKKARVKLPRSKYLQVRKPHYKVSPNGNFFAYFTYRYNQRHEIRRRIHVKSFKTSFIDKLFFNSNAIQVDWHFTPKIQRPYSSIDYEFSPDSTCLAVKIQQRNLQPAILLLDAKTGKSKWKKAISVTHYKFSLYGKYLAMKNNRTKNRVTLYNINTGQLVWITPQSKENIADFGFISDNKQVEVTFLNNTLQLFDIKTGKPQWKNPKSLVGPQTHGTLQLLAFSPNNRLFAVSFSDGTFQVFDAKTAQPQLKNAITHVSFYRFFKGSNGNNRLLVGSQHKKNKYSCHYKMQAYLLHNKKTRLAQQYIQESVDFIKKALFQEPSIIPTKKIITKKSKITAPASLFLAEKYQHLLTKKAKDQ